MTWDDEVAAIKRSADLRGVDWAYIAAIRREENGKIGREFGVLSRSAPDYQTQLDTCCATIRTHLNEFPTNPLLMVTTATGPRRIIYRNEFILYSGHRYAPLGADNDPEGRNVFWPGNVRAIYRQMLGVV